MTYDLAEERTKKIFEEQLAKEVERRTELEKQLKQTQQELKLVERNIAYFDGLLRWLSKDSSEAADGDSHEESSSLSQAQQAQEVQARSPENGSLQSRQLSLMPAYFDVDTSNEDDEEEGEYMLSATESERPPMEMLKPQFKGQSMTDIVLSILKQEQRPMRAVEIAFAVYQTESKEEFTRARNSIGAELRTGADKKGWKKAGRGRYVIESISQKDSKD
ncbi:hypothetical protein ACE1CI_10280 [Aerosakkonemataceae cyanobacterium BLCC-F50]|uniref:Uncharacterized protein n=1 Tax=Floridaenema flaviceps BLCC-F50 TaxID=3153642 RepID=A0ABV4XNJ8_9CYAN